MTNYRIELEISTKESMSPDAIEEMIRDVLDDGIANAAQLYDTEIVHYDVLNVEETEERE